MILEKYKNFTLLLIIFIFSRIVYYNYFNISFDSWTIDVYWQFFPKILLKEDLINSIIYNHYQPPFLNLIVGLLIKMTDNYVLILNTVFLICGYFSFLLIYLICIKFQFTKNFSFLITALLMIMATTILYENHLYKEYLTFFFLIWLFYSSYKILENPKSLLNIISMGLSLSLLCLTRETFHIFWGYILILFIQKKLFLSNKIILFTIYTLIVFPIYLKNLIIFDNFAINTASTYEHLNQKIDFIKEMKNPERHKKIRELVIGDYKNYENFKKKTSPIFDIQINSSAYYYKDFFNYDYKIDNKLLQTNTWFNEVWFEVNKHRKNDYFLVLKEYPSLLILNYLNAATRHLFFSSDYFAFTKHNADKMKAIIKISDCIKLTPVCFYDYGFNWENKISPGGENYIGIDTGPMTYKEKIIYSFQYTNFLLVFIYFYLLFYLIKNCFNFKRNSEENNIIIFWLFTFVFIFLSLIIFEDGEISRHRFPFDYLCFIIFLKNLKLRFFKESKFIKK